MERASPRPLVRPLGRDAAAFVAAGLAGGSLLGFVLVASLWSGQPAGWDVRLLEAFRRAEEPAQLVGPDWLGPAVQRATDLGDGLVLIALGLVVAAVLLAHRRRLAGWWVMLSGLVGFAIQEVLKWSFDRARPAVVPHLELVTKKSFPSGHAMMSAVVYVTIALVLWSSLRRGWARAGVLLAAVSLTLLVGLTRVMLGVHYPSDVLGGWLGGLGWAMLCWLAARRVTGTRSACPSQAGP